MAISAKLKLRIYDIIIRDRSDIMIKLEQYRDTWLSEKMDEVIGFYPREFYPLDNFSSFKVEWNGYLYASL